MSRSARLFVVYGFSSVHDALGAESVLKDAGLAVTPVPSPKELGELCGIALRLDPADADRAGMLLTSAGMEPKARAEIEDV